MQNPASTHPTATVLASFVSGELADAAAADVRSHLKTCSACRRRLARFIDRPVVRPSGDGEQQPTHFAPGRRRAWVTSSVLGGVLTLATLVGWAASELDNRLPNNAVALGIPKDFSAQRSAAAESRGEPSGLLKATVKVPAVQSAQTPANANRVRATIERNEAKVADLRLPGPSSSAPSSSAPSIPKLAGESHEQGQQVPGNPIAGRGGPSAQTIKNLAAANSALFLKDLIGWKQQGDNWRVVDGTIVGSTRGGEKTAVYLCSPREYKDFDLKFRVLFPQGVGIGGVQFRSKLKDADQVLVIGPRCVICGKDGNVGHPSGSLVSEGTGKLDVPANAKLAAKFIKPGENRFQIRCEGTQVLIKVNGITMAKAGAIPEKGVIAWYLDASPSPQEIRIKDIHFTDLTSSPPLAAAETGRSRDRAIIKAELIYAAAIEKANHKLDGRFSSTITKLRAKNHGGDAELPEVAVVEAEQKAFAQSGFIPWSTQMRGAACDYLNEIDEAQSRLENLFDKATEAASRTHDDHRVAELRQDAESVLAPHVVAIALQVGDGGERMEFRSDGIVTTPGDGNTDTERSWKLLATGRLKIEEADPNQSEYVTIKECALAPDGKSWTTSDENDDQQTWQFVRE